MVSRLAQRWQREHYTRTLLKYASVTQRGVSGQPVDLIIWPEFAVGFYLEQEPLLRAQLGALTQRLAAPLLFGAPRREHIEDNTQYFNSAYMVSGGGQLVDVYDKRQLLPFAEYRPFRWMPLLHDHTPQHPREFAPGDNTTVFPLSTAAFGVMICYEATHVHLARQLALAGAQLLVNISNDTWLVQDSKAAAEQHFSMAIFRAVETRRPLVRVATLGISGFIDPTGHVVSASTTTEGVLLGKVTPLDEVTFYSRWGDWFAAGCLGLCLIIGARLFVKAA